MVCPVLLEDGIELGNVLRIVVAQQVRWFVLLLVGSQDHVAGLLYHPGTLGVGGHAGAMDTSAAQVDEEHDEHVH